MGFLSICTLPQTNAEPEVASHTLLSKQRWGSMLVGRSIEEFLKATLLETNMETQKGPYKDYSPSKLGLYGLPC